MARKRAGRAQSGRKRARATRKPDPPAPPASLSPAAYAKRRGVSREAVSKAIRQGRIPVLPGGRLDPAAADAAWLANSLARPGPPGPALAGGGNGVVVSLTEAQIRLTFAKAQREELELAEASGRLVPVADVRDAAFRCTRAARDLLQTVPDRLAEVLVGVAEPAEIRRLLREELGRAIDELEALEPEPLETPAEVEA